MRPLANYSVLSSLIRKTQGINLSGRAVTKVNAIAGITGSSTSLHSMRKAEPLGVIEWRSCHRNMTIRMWWKLQKRRPGRGQLEDQSHSPGTTKWCWFCKVLHLMVVWSHHRSAGKTVRGKCWSWSRREQGQTRTHKDRTHVRMVSSGLMVSWWPIAGI